jgi:hypothetical protein
LSWAIADTLELVGRKVQVAHAVVLEDIAETGNRIGVA